MKTGDIVVVLVETDYFPIARITKEHDGVFDGEMFLKSDAGFTNMSTNDIRLATSQEFDKYLLSNPEFAKLNDEREAHLNKLKRKYKVVVKEVLFREVEVEATSEYDAKDKVMDMYRNEEIVLTGDDFNDVEFEVL